MTYIFDACAILALIKKEKGADKVRTLLDEAKNKKSIIFMNTINLIEVNYYFYRLLGKEKSASILNEVYSFPINFIDTIDDVIFSETSRLKVQYAIPLGDSIGLATAIKIGGTFVTADHSDFEQIEKAEKLPFLWFR